MRIDRSMKKNKLKVCTAHGLKIWECSEGIPFNVPKGAIYGRIDGKMFCCTKLPDGINRIHATRVFVWVYNNSRHIWHEITVYKWFDDAIEAFHGNIKKATWGQHVCWSILAMLNKYPTLKVEGYYPSICRHYIEPIAPKRKTQQIYQHGRDCFSQRCVDGNGYKPSKDTRKDGSPNEYAGAMKESFCTIYPSFKEDNYWALKGLV